MDGLVEKWDVFGTYLKRRPAAFIGAMLGLVLFLFAQTYLLTTQPLQQRQIDKISTKVCDARDPDRVQCQLLLQALIDNASEKQKQELSKIEKK